MYARLSTVVTLCVAVATLAAQSGQSSDQQQPTFVTGTQYVRVDMYVTRDGVLVGDLRPEDVRIYEDGVPQTIQAFERVVIRPPDPLEPGLEPRTLEESRRLAADPRSRVFVVFLDSSLSRDGGQLRARPHLPIFRQLHDRLGPDDLVAVMMPRMRPEDLSFGRGLEGLAAREDEIFGPHSVDRPGLGNRWDDEETALLYEACYPERGSPAGEMLRRRREQMTLDALEDLAVYLGALREERKGVLLITDGWRMYLRNPALAAPRSEWGEVPRLPRPPIDDRGLGDGPAIIATHRGVVTTDGADRMKCELDRVALANLDHSRRLQEIIDRANTSNVSFYPISAGLTTEGASPLAAVELAEQTDGYAIVNTNNLSSGLQRIVSDSSAYYLLGYTSTNAELDGSYRRISVRVDRPGVHVRARAGYVAAPPVRAVDVELAGALPEPDPVARAMDRLAGLDVGRGLRLREAAWAQPVPGGGSAGAFWLAGEVDAQARRGAGGATADVSVLNERGEPVLSRQVAVAAIHPAFAVRVPEAGTVEPGEYLARVQLRDGTGAAVASETIRVTVPREPAPLGEAVLWRRGPSTGPQPVQAADPRFRRNERLRLEVPVLSFESVSARLLDRTGAPLAVPVSVTERLDDAEALRWAVVDLTLAPLATGDYLIEVANGDATQLTAFRIVP